MELSKLDCHKTLAEQQLSSAQMLTLTTGKGLLTDHFPVWISTFPCRLWCFPLLELLAE